MMALDSAETEQLRAERAADGKRVAPDEAAGMSPEEIFELFYTNISFARDKEGWKTPFDPERYRGGVKIATDIVNAKDGKVMAEAVAGQAGRFDLFSSLPVTPFPGGKHARAPLLTLAMTCQILLFLNLHQVELNQIVSG